MKIEIDQSGKVEDTAKPTVLAYTNDEQRSILIPASSKRQLQELYRRIGKPQVFVYQVFSLGIFCLIRRLRQHHTIVIDTEYPGHDRVLTNMIMTLLSVHGKPAHDIHFARIGKHPAVHYAAKNVFDKKQEADEMINAEKLMKPIKKADERLRACFATLVDAQSRALYTHYIPKFRRVKRKKRV